MESDGKALVGILVASDAEEELLAHTGETLAKFGVGWVVRRDAMGLKDFADEAAKAGWEVLVATSTRGLAQRLAVASVLPVLCVPVDGEQLKAEGLLMEIARTPAGMPAGCLAIGKAGAINSGLMAVAILSNTRGELRDKLKAFRREQEQRVLGESLDG